MMGLSVCILICLYFIREVLGDEAGLNDTACYKKLGCFYLGYPWSPANSKTYLAPQHPDEINTSFYLTTRENYGIGRLKIKRKSDVNAKDWTFVIIHGFLSSSFENWISSMEQSLIKRGNYNVISVDWSKGCSGFNYYQAVANTRLVAAVINRFFKSLILKKRISPERLHLIGHSLGAHVASYVGSYIQGIAKITGLDPSLPGFTLRENSIRLDPGDAEFVEVIHTNAGTFGHYDPLGHVDFYINGGSYQPGCSFADIQKLYSSGVIMEYLICSHSRAQFYYIESLQSNCKFWGRKWNLTGFPDVKQPCDEDVCQIMGLKSALLPGRGVYYVKTNASPPFCISEVKTHSGHHRDQEYNKSKILMKLLRRRAHKRRHQSLLKWRRKHGRFNQRCFRGNCSLEV